MRHRFGRQPEPWSWPTSLWAASVGNRKRLAFEGKCIIGKHLPGEAWGAVATEMLDNRHAERTWSSGS